MDDSKVDISEFTIVGEGETQDHDLGLSKKPRGLKVATKVKQRKLSKYVSSSWHPKAGKLPRGKENNPFPCHAIFIFLDPVLLAVLQIEYQNKKESPFDTHPVQMQTFLVAICIYSMVLGIKIQNNDNKHARCDQILSFMLLACGSVSSGALLSILMQGVLSWLVLVILGSIPIILGRHLIKNSVYRILGLVAKLDLKSKFSTMVSIFHRKEQGSDNLADRVEGI